MGTICLLFEDEVLVCAVRGPSGAFEKIDVDGAGPSWLYFHVGPTEIRNDDFAKERFEAGDAAAFGDFYDIICDPQRTYSMYDVANAAVTLAGQLLDKVQDAVARQTGQRATDKLGTYLSFNPGIKDASRKVITAFLAEKGFDILGVVDHHEVILTGLQGRGVIGPTANVALVTASFGDLRFEYLKCTPDEVTRQSEVLAGKGDDARVQVLAELMVDKVAKRYASQLLNYPDLLQAEIKRFYRQARTCLNQFQDGELRVRVTLSDGTTGVLVIDERDVNTPVIPKFRHADDKLRAFIGTALNLPKTDRIVIASRALDTDDFASLLARSAGVGKILRASGDLLSLQLLGLGNVVSRAEAARAVPAPVDAVAVRAPTAQTTAPSVPVVTAPPPAPPVATVTAPIVVAIEPAAGIDRAWRTGVPLPPLGEDRAVHASQFTRGDKHTGGGTDIAPGVFGAAPDGLPLPQLWWFEHLTALSDATVEKGPAVTPTSRTGRHQRLWAEVNAWIDSLTALVFADSSERWVNRPNQYQIGKLSYTYWARVYPDGSDGLEDAFHIGLQISKRLKWVDKVDPSLAASAQGAVLTMWASTNDGLIERLDEVVLRDLYAKAQMDTLLQQPDLWRDGGALVRSADGAKSLLQPAQRYLDHIASGGAPGRPSVFSPLVTIDLVSQNPEEVARIVASYFRLLAMPVRSARQAALASSMPASIGTVGNASDGLTRGEPRVPAADRVSPARAVSPAPTEEPVQDTNPRPEPSIEPRTEAPQFATYAPALVRKTVLIAFIKMLTPAATRISWAILLVLIVWSLVPDQATIPASAPAATYEEAAPVGVDAEAGPVGVGHRCEGVDVIECDPEEPMVDQPEQTLPIGTVGDTVTVPSEPSAPEVVEETALSEIEVDSAVVRDPNSMAPAYPAALLAKGIEGGTFVQYVVDTAGRVEASTIQVIRTTHPEFATAVTEALALMRFQPAVRRSQRVRQSVQQNFAFKAVRGTALLTVVKPDILLVHNTTQFWLLDISNRSSATVLSTRTASIREGDLHPDGDRVIYRTSRFGGGNVGVEFRMSTGVQTASIGEAWYPSYSRGGDSVVAGVTGPSMRIYQLRPTGAQTDVAACSNGYPRWIDGDTKLLCATNVIWTYDLASGTSTPVDFRRPHSWTPGAWLNCPRLSSDGTTISFSIEATYQLYFVNRDGSNLREVGPSGSGSSGCHASWSPREPLFAFIRGGAIQFFNTVPRYPGLGFKPPQFSIPLPSGVVTANSIAGWR